MARNLVVTAVLAALAGILTRAAVGKLLAPGSSLGALHHILPRQLKPSPDAGIAAVRAIAIGELILGAAIAIGGGSPGALGVLTLTVAGTVFAFFVAIAIYAWRRGTPCGCFGQARPADWRDAARAGLMLTSVFALAIIGPLSGVWHPIAFGVSALVSLLVAAGAVATQRDYESSPQTRPSDQDALVVSHDETVAQGSKRQLSRRAFASRALQTGLVTASASFAGWSFLEGSARAETRSEGRRPTLELLGRTRDVDKAQLSKRVQAIAHVADERGLVLRWDLAYTLIDTVAGHRTLLVVAPDASLRHALVWAPRAIVESKAFQGFQGKPFSAKEVEFALLIDSWRGEIVFQNLDGDISTLAVDLPAKLRFPRIPWDELDPRRVRFAVCASGCMDGPSFASCNAKHGGCLVGCAVAAGLCCAFTACGAWCAAGFVACESFCNYCWGRCHICEYVHMA